MPSPAARGSTGMMRSHVLGRRPQPRARRPCRPSGARSRCTWPTACPASRWWAWPTPRSRNRASGCAPRCSKAASPSRTTSASPSTWRRPTCPRSRAASTCRSRWASWPPTGRSTPQRLARLRVRRRAVAGRRTAAGARRAGAGPGRAARRRRSARLVLPTDSAQAAAQVRGLDVRARRHACCRWCSAACRATTRRPLPRAAARRRRRRPPAAPDLRDVKGQAAAKRALEIAAAGGHSLLLVGPPGTGKSMLAQRLAGLLPPMDDDEALASAALQGLATQGFDAARLRPAAFARAAPLGQRGGAGGRRLAAAAGRDLAGPRRRAVPRRVARVRRAPRWRRCASRWKAGSITISRAARQAAFPARFQLVAAMNPCPCGWLGAFAATGKACRCTPDGIARYRAACPGRCSTASTCRSRCHAGQARSADGPGRRRSLSRRGRSAWPRARQRQLQRQGDAQRGARRRPHRRAVRAGRGRGALRRRRRRSGWTGRAAACTAR